VVAEQATKGFTDLRTNLVNRTRGLSLAGATAPYVDFTGTNRTATVGEEKKDGGEGSSSSAAAAAAGGEGGGLLEKLRKGASQRIAEIEAAEAKADEYLIKFGSNIGSFLRDAVTIAPPSNDDKRVVFESKGSDDAKKQILSVLSSYSFLSLKFCQKLYMLTRLKIAQRDWMHNCTYFTQIFHCFQLILYRRVTLSLLRTFRLTSRRNRLLVILKSIQS
jgi:hypothetical protein